MGRRSGRLARAGAAPASLGERAPAWPSRAWRAGVLPGIALGRRAGASLPCCAGDGGIKSEYPPHGPVFLRYNTLVILSDMTKKAGAALLLFSDNVALEQRLLVARDRSRQRICRIRIESSHLISRERPAGRAFLPEAPTMSPCPMSGDHSQAGHPTTGSVAAREAERARLRRGVIHVRLRHFYCTLEERADPGLRVSPLSSAQAQDGPTSRVG